MGIFRKKSNIHLDNTEGKTPIRFKRRGRAGKLGAREEDLTKKTKRKKIRRIVIWSIVGVILVVGGYFGYRAYRSFADMFANGSGVLDLFNGNAAKALKGESRGRTNILLLGVGDDDHDGSTLADTVMILSIDYKTNNIALISVPRDTYVKIPGNGYSKINAAHAYGEQKSTGGGPELMRSVVEETFGQTIDYYVRVNFSGLKEAVDAVGGVTVDVENAFCDYNYPVEYKGDTRTVCFKAGSQTMNGIKALQYSRSRHAYGVEGSDFARAKRQQKVIIALKEKMLTKNTTYNPKVALDLLSVLGNNVKTDFQVSEFARLYEIAKGVDQSKIIQKNFDSSAEGMLVASSGTAAGYILQPATGNWKAIQDYIKNIFLLSGIKTEAAKISILNGTYINGLALTASSDLTGLGYKVAATGNAATKTYKKTTITDYTGGTKPETVKALEKKFGVTATKGTASTATAGYDIQIIVGSDYAD